MSIHNRAIIKIVNETGKYSGMFIVDVNPERSLESQLDNIMHNAQYNSEGWGVMYSADGKPPEDFIGIVVITDEEMLRRNERINEELYGKSEKFIRKISLTISGIVGSEMTPEKLINEGVRFLFVSKSFGGSIDSSVIINSIEEIG